MSIIKLQKKDGWEARLNALVMKYYDLPFTRGQNCCFLAISDVYDALTDGESPISSWRGKFKSKTKAMALYFANTGTTSFERVFQWANPVDNWKMAQRGDIGMMIDENGVECLGWVSLSGTDFLVRCEDKPGLVRFPLSDKIRLWRLE